MPEQRKRLHCVAEITLSTTFLLASEVPAIASFARSGLPQKPNSKTRERGTINLGSVPRSRVGLPKSPRIKNRFALLDPLIRPTLARQAANYPAAALARLECGLH